MFTGKTILERIDSKNYKINSNLSFENNDFKVTVKKGLVTDGASIPRIFWSIIGCPSNGKYVGSAIIHDGLYMSEIISRKDADKIFLDMLKHNGIGYIKRNLMYFAVRLGGYFVWRKHNQDTVSLNKKFVLVEKFYDDVAD